MNAILDHAARFCLVSIFRVFFGVFFCVFFCAFFRVFGRVFGRVFCHVSNFSNMSFCVIFSLSS